jgi:hypothetical protein
MAEGQAEAIDTVFTAIHEGRPNAELLAYQYLQVLPKIAEGQGSQVWMIPSELTKALEGFASAFGASAAKPEESTGEPNGAAPSRPRPTRGRLAADGAADLPTGRAADD